MAAANLLQTISTSNTTTTTTTATTTATINDEITCKKQEKLIRNRASAEASRKRKRQVQANLEAENDSLKAVNGVLESQCLHLRAKVDELERLVEDLKRRLGQQVVDVGVAGIYLATPPAFSSVVSPMLLPTPTPTPTTPPTSTTNIMLTSSFNLLEDRELENLAFFQEDYNLASSPTVTLKSFFGFIMIFPLLLLVLPFFSNTLLTLSSDAGLLRSSSGLSCLSCRPSFSVIPYHHIKKYNIRSSRVIEQDQEMMEESAPSSSSSSTPPPLSNIPPASPFTDVILLPKGGKSLISTTTTTPTIPIAPTLSNRESSFSSNNKNDKIDNQLLDISLFQTVSVIPLVNLSYSLSSPPPPPSSTFINGDENGSRRKRTMMMREWTSLEILSAALSSVDSTTTTTTSSTTTTAAINDEGDNEEEEEEKEEQDGSNNNYLWGMNGLYLLPFHLSMSPDLSCHHRRHHFYNNNNDNNNDQSPLYGNNSRSYSNSFSDSGSSNKMRFSMLAQIDSKMYLKLDLVVTGACLLKKF